MIFVIKMASHMILYKNDVAYVNSILCAGNFDATILYKNPTTGKEVSYRTLVGFNESYGLFGFGMTTSQCIVTYYIYIIIFSSNLF